MAFVYSVRLSRRAVGRPGRGSSAAAPSMVASSQAAKDAYRAGSGRGRPAGGIVADRSLRITRSHASVSRPT